MGVGPIWVDVQKRELGTNNGWELRACDNTKSIVGESWNCVKPLDGCGPIMSIKG